MVDEEELDVGLGVMVDGEELDVGLGVMVDGEELDVGELGLELASSSKFLVTDRPFRGFRGRRKLS